MDWYGLPDNFVNWMPLSITNNDNRSLFFQGDLSGGHVNFTVRFSGYSGVQMGVVSGESALNVKMTWTLGTSGLTASPYSGLAALKLTAFVSSNYTGEAFSTTFGFPLIYFNRDLHIKVFGDDYNDNFAPRPSVSGTSGGSFVSGQRLWWAVSYVRSGWESDPSTATAWFSGGLGENPFSGARYTLSWPSIAGATQYFVWRWSGSVGASINPNQSHVSYSGIRQTASLATDGGMELNPIDLIYASNQTTIIDDNLPALVDDTYRENNWINYYNGAGFIKREGAGNDATSYLSSGSSRVVNSSDPNVVIPNAFIWEHAYYLDRNLSGNLSGPYWMTLHIIDEPLTLAASDALDARQIGFPVAPSSLFGGRSGTATLASGWIRFCFEVPSLNASGYFHMQGVMDAGPAVARYFDDVYICAVS